MKGTEKKKREHFRVRKGSEARESLDNPIK